MSSSDELDEIFLGGSLNTENVRSVGPKGSKGLCAEDLARNDVLSSFKLLGVSRFGKDCKRFWAIGVFFRLSSMVSASWISSLYFLSDSTSARIENCRFLGEPIWVSRRDDFFLPIGELSALFEQFLSSIFWRSAFLRLTPLCRGSGCSGFFNDRRFFSSRFLFLASFREFLRFSASMLFCLRYKKELLFDDASW